MTDRNFKRLRRRVHAHTVRCIFNYCDRGGGTDTKRAVKSADRLFWLVDEIVKEEALKAHSAGYAEGAQSR